MEKIANIQIKDPEKAKKLNILSNRKTMQEKYVNHLKQELMLLDNTGSKYHDYINFLNKYKDDIEYGTLNFGVGFVAIKNVDKLIDKLNEHLDLCNFQIDAQKQKNKLAEELLERLDNEINDLLGN